MLLEGDRRRSFGAGRIAAARMMNAHAALPHLRRPQCLGVAPPLSQVEQNCLQVVALRCSSLRPCWCWVVRVWHAKVKMLGAEALSRQCWEQRTVLLCAWSGIVLQRVRKQDSRLAGKVFFVHRQAPKWQQKGPQGMMMLAGGLQLQLQVPVSPSADFAPEMERRPGCCPAYCWLLD